MKKYGIGVFPGKFCPPHTAHLNPIILGASDCHLLYVVVADSSERTKERCEKAGLPYMDLKTRAEWMINATADIPNVIVRIMSEDGLLDYPDGSEEWNRNLRAVIGQHIDVLYGGDEYYRETYAAHQPGSIYICYDRMVNPISSTMIRNNFGKFRHFILPEAKEFFNDTR